MNRFVITLFVVILLMGSGLWYLYSEYSDMKVRLATETQNRIALGDSLRVSTNLIGELTYSKAILITEKEELKSLNQGLHDHIETLDGKVLQLSNTVYSLEMQLDTVENNLVTKYNDSIYGIKWGIDKDFGNGNRRILTGETNFRIARNPFEVVPINTIITRDYTNFSVVSGLREIGGVVESFSTSKYPGLTVRNLETAIVSPDMNPLGKGVKNKFNLGLHVGYGLTHNPFTNETISGLQVGGGLQFRPF